jgi:hypothetical protein
MIAAAPVAKPIPPNTARIAILFHVVIGWSAMRAS